MIRPLTSITPNASTLGLLLALIVVACAPSSARARCGGYATSTPGHALGASLAMLESIEAETPAGDELRPSLPGGDRPCSGPRCSEKRSEAPMSPTTPLPVEGGQWGLAITGPRLAIPGPAGAPAAEGRPRPRRVANPLERPPRSPSVTS